MSEYGDKLADKIATFGGSWTFLGCFMAFIMVWMSINVFILMQEAFDPYPFILLNLILSCIAAIQAPIIMMSQNRQAERDRRRDNKAFEINKKTEEELLRVSKIIEQFIVAQTQRTIDIQETVKAKKKRKKD